MRRMDWQSVTQVFGAVCTNVWAGPETSGASAALVNVHGGFHNHSEPHALGPPFSIQMCRWSFKAQELICRRPLAVWEGLSACALSLHDKPCSAEQVPNAFG